MKSRGATRALATGAMLALVAGTWPIHVLAQGAGRDESVREGMEFLNTNQLPQAIAAFERAIAAETNVAHAYFGLGMVRLRQGETRAAEQLLRKSVEKLQMASDLPDAYAALGVAMLRNGRTREARVYVDKSLAAYSGLWLGRYAKARLDILDGKLAEAEAGLAHGAALKGLRNGEDLFQFGEALRHLAIDDLQAAVVHAQAAVSLNPSDPEAAGVLADIYVKQGAAPLAVEVLRSAMDASGSPWTSAMHQALGTAQERAGQFPAAIESFQKATQLDEKYAPAYKSIGALLARAKQNAKAVPYLLKYSELEATDTDGLVLLANTAVVARSYRRANEAARKAYDLDSTLVETKLALARASFHDRDKPTSARMYRAVDNEKLYDAADYTRLAQLALDRADIAGARGYADKALELDPKLPDTQIALGLIELKDNRPEAAIDRLQRAIELSADAPAVQAGAQLNLGVVLLQQKRTKEGIAALRAASALAPDNPSVRLPLAQALVATDSLAAASTEYQSIVAVDPKNVRALRGLGLCHIKLKNYGEAVTPLEGATSGDPSNADGWALLGQSYLGVGEMDKAKSAFERALSISPNNQAASKGLAMAQQSP